MVPFNVWHRRRFRAAFGWSWNTPSRMDADDIGVSHRVGSRIFPRFARNSSERQVGGARCPSSKGGNFPRPPKSVFFARGQWMPGGGGGCGGEAQARGGALCPARPAG